MIIGQMFSMNSDDDSLPDSAARRKSLLRAECERVRSRISEQAAGFARMAAAHALGELASLRMPRTVACYHAFRSELDTAPLVGALRGQDFRICLPVVEEAGKPLVFQEWSKDSELVAGRYGVKAPASGDRVVPQVLIVPLLAFDDACHRLGYGGGYYDRTIAALRAEAGLLAIGYAFSRQHVRHIPLEPWDVGLDAVVTERGVVRPAGSATSAPEPETA
jgi:5-formyltetrahydrofolate cyclo-ligase